MSAIRRKNFHAIGARNDPDACSFVLMLAPPREGSALEKASRLCTNKHRHQVCRLEKQVTTCLPASVGCVLSAGLPSVVLPPPLVRRCQQD